MPVGLVWADWIGVDKRGVYGLGLAGQCGQAAGPLNPCGRGQTYGTMETPPRVFSSA